MSITIRDDETGQEWSLDGKWAEVNRAGSLVLRYNGSNGHAATFNPKPKTVTYGGITFEVGATRRAVAGEWYLESEGNPACADTVSEKNLGTAHHRPILTPVAIEGRP